MDAGDVESVLQLLWKEHVVAGGDYGVQRCHPDGSMIGMKLIRSPGIEGHDGVRVHLSDYVADLSAEIQVHLNLAVVVSKEEAAGHAEPMRRLPLLLFANLGELESSYCSVMAALVAAGDG